ncbi:DNA translocase FtsK [Chlamydiia bacterium]|nr:DNA translocase FtsK [Chlamydiia bacterium]
MEDIPSEGDTSSIYKTIINDIKLFSLCIAVVAILTTYLTIDTNTYSPSSFYESGVLVKQVCFFLFGALTPLVCLTSLYCMVYHLINKAPINNKKISLTVIFFVSLSITLTVLADNNRMNSNDWSYYSITREVLDYDYSTYSTIVKDRTYIGGIIAYFLYKDVPLVNLHSLFGKQLSLWVFGLITLTIGMWLTKPILSQFVNFIKRKYRERKQRLEEIKQNVHFNNLQETLDVNEEDDLMIDEYSRPESIEYESETQQIEFEEQKNSITPKKVKSIELKTNFRKSDPSQYTPPPINLLNKKKTICTKQLQTEIDGLKSRLESTLNSFNIEATVGNIQIGPRVISFEVHPSQGVKVQKIKNIEDDIALNLRAKSTRIIAPIPGKAAVGIEIPSPVQQEVNYREMLNEYKRSAQSYRLPLILGKTVSGEDVIADLAKMPHLIIAGATGSGKSVCINTIIMSILLTSSPEDVRLIMVDPKKVELTPYTSLPHMIAPVITDSNEAVDALKWLVVEMESRYEVLKQVGFRNIESFNNRDIDDDFEATLSVEVPRKMYYIVAIIDELADLMMTVSNEIETYIARIAQMARAVGIHLILATQRPSREVITGLIKANFPARIAFKVSSKINSQIILDEPSAETLLGNGDALFLNPYKPSLIRSQCPYISDQEIASIVDHIKSKYPTQYIMSSFNLLQNSNNEGSLSDDALYDDAYKIVIATGNASTTFLQRKLRIGYARAASLMDDLESNGVVSPAEGSKGRKILVQTNEVSG